MKPKKGKEMFTWVEIEKAIDSHKDKIISEIEGQGMLGAGDAVDLTSKLIQIGKVESANESLKLSVKGFLLKEKI